MVQVDEAQVPLLKSWIVRKLENVSDADSDVLADYVLALIKTDEPESVARSNSIENLQDFLQDGAAPFVDEVFTAIRTRSYDPSFVRDTKGSHNKRRFDDVEDQEMSREGGIVNGRGTKYSNGGKRARLQTRHGHQSRTGDTTAYFDQPPYAPMMNVPTDMQGFDPSNPLAAFMAMQAAMGMFPGMLGTESNHLAGKAMKAGSKNRCRDYAKKGFCARGATCPFDHGEEHVVIPFSDEYDPKNAAMLGNFPWDSTPKTKRREKNTQHLKRADISLRGPNYDQTNSTIVVDKIPLGNLESKQISEFFAQFGDIVKIEINNESALAVIEYQQHSAAKAAYESPKPIFDNRFVKVFWHRPDHHAKMGKSKRVPFAKNKTTFETKDDDPEADVDAEAFAKRQQEAQRKHEEAKAQMAEAEKQKKLLDERLSSMELERAKMADAIARKTGIGEASAVSEFEKTQQLKEQLAKLEAEALSLGIDPKAEDSPDTNRSWNYRGRGGYRARARGSTAHGSSRGGWHGSEGAVKRLDNRPRTLAISFESGDYEAHEEALRQYLLFGGGESAALSRHPQRPDTALLEFKARYQAENFMTSPSLAQIPHIGKTSVTWYRAEEASQDGVSNSMIDKGSALTREPTSTREEDTEYDMDDEVRWG